jgi:hypothetical protein
MSAEDSIMAIVRDVASGYSVLVEDDGRVAYGYLTDRKNKFIADVWLYNRSHAPAEGQWHDKEAMPFLNPAEYVRTDLAIRFMEQPADVRISWEASEQYEAIARIYLHDELVGILVPGAKPGWSVLATKDGPIAKRFTDHWK